MHHSYCKNVNILDREGIYFCITQCLSDKWNRYDVVNFIHEYLPSFSKDEVRNIIKYNRDFLKGTLYTIADALAYEIKTRTVHFKPIKYKEKYDSNSKKTREIGVQSIKHQLYDYIAVYYAREVWEKKIGDYQCASMPGRGQVFGKKLIENCIRTFPKKTRFAVKGDIRKCYPSINTRRLKKLLKKDIDNEDLLYLIFYLIDSFKQGLSIGSFLSQYLCNYYLSFAYHYIETNLSRNYYFMLFYMDDFILIAENKSELATAMIKIVQYFKEYLDLEVKNTWQIFPIDYFSKDGKRCGRAIDMMGYVIYRTHTEVRPCIFLKARRLYIYTYIHYGQFNKRIPEKLAYQCISYYGWFVNSNSEWFIREYNVKKLVHMSEAAVSYYSKQKNNRESLKRDSLFFLF